MSEDDFDALLETELKEYDDGVIEGPKIKIMVVDDDPSIRNAVVALLEEEYELVVCRSGQEALQRLNKQIYVILLDIKMEGMSGFESCLEFKKLYKHIPVVFHSAYQDFKDPFEIMNEFQPFGYIAKGISEVELRVMIKNAADYYSQILKNEILSNELSEINGNLEKMVGERTADLIAAKEKQDGDYFLTSLLLDALESGCLKTERTVVGSLLRQKKNFQFRKWKKSIGGDLCIVHKLHLAEKNFIVFMNADAMGKSSQGAGGAIALGSIFNFLTMRGKASDNTTESPEDWIKRCVQELDQVFVGFGGSMLVSVVLGLLDEDTGQMYLLNAEHPKTVLLRNGVAQFIEKGIYHKIGSGQLNLEGDQDCISTIQLQTGDTVIAGSDGRDDLELEEKGGMRIINSDENLFLRCVEAGNGQLDPVLEEILKYGKFIDDVSLMRIEYTRRNGS